MQNCWLMDHWTIWNLYKYWWAFPVWNTIVINCSFSLLYLFSTDTEKSQILFPLSRGSGGIQGKRISTILGKGGKVGEASKNFLEGAYPVDTERKLNVHKTFRRRPGRLLNVLCIFSLRPVSTGLVAIHFIMT